MARLFHWAPEIQEPDLFELESPVLKPGSGDVNAEGFRDYPYPVQKPKQVFRILVIGDSIGFGMCTDKETLSIDTVFPKVLERRLNYRAFSGYKRVEVLNLSVSGYDIKQEVALLEERGLQFGPDLVIVAYGLNDAREVSPERSYFRQYPLRPFYRNLFVKSDLFRALWLKGRTLVHPADRHDLKEAQQKTQGESAEQGFRRLNLLGHAHRFKTLIVVFPLFEEYKRYSNIAQHQEIGQKAAANEFHLLDLLPAYQEASQGDYKALQGRCDQAHPNELGHQAAALAIADYLMDRRLIQTGSPHGPDILFWLKPVLKKVGIRF